MSNQILNLQANSKIIQRLRVKIKGKRDIFKTISQRRSFNEWNDFRALEFQRYNETERLILYFRLHLGILNRKEISTKTGIPEYQIVKFVKAIMTYGYEELS